MQPQWEVADVLRHTDIAGFNVHQQKTLRALKDCRTAALGGHVDACDGCCSITISYNSCRNRHCPKCQGHKREEWIQKREADLLPCTYFHLVFTLPQELNAVAMPQPKMLYDALFKAAWQTLTVFAGKSGVQPGMISVLHTWGQNLSLHPHLHCIVPGAGVNKKGRWQILKHSEKFLFPVKAMSLVFRARYVQSLRQCGFADKALIESLFQKPWVVYAKRPFGGPKQVIEYLGRYTHKVAISNHRIVSVDEQQVSFTYKDYRDSAKTKTMTLSNKDFVQRFSRHILPHRFVRIRHYGILSSSWKRGKLQALRRSVDAVSPVVKIKTLLRKCTSCKTGTLVTIEVFGKRGPPPNYITGQQTAPVA